MDSEFPPRLPNARAAPAAPRPRRIRTRRRSASQLARQTLLAACGILALAALVVASRFVSATPALLSLVPGAAWGEWLTPMLAAAFVQAARARLGGWTGWAAALGLLAGGMTPLAADMPRLAWSPDMLLSGLGLTALALPLLQAASSRPVAQRVQQALARAWPAAPAWHGVLPALLAGVLAPALVLGAAAALIAFLLPHHSLPWAAALAWALGGLAAATHHSTSPQAGKTGHGSRLIALAALVAIALQTPPLAARLSPLADLVPPGEFGALTFLLPQLLLGGFALLSPARHAATLGLMLLLGWMAAQPADAATALGAAALAWLPLLALVRQTKALAGDPEWLPALDDQRLALAEWHWPGGLRHASAGWLALTGDGRGDGSVEDARAVNGSPLAWLAKVHPRDRDAARQTLRRLLSSPDKQAERLSLRLAPAGGDWRRFRLAMRVTVRDRQGRARTVIASLLDAGWRQMAEDRERMAAALFEQIDGGIAVVDPQSRIVEANPAYCTLMQEPRERLLGRIATPLSASTLDLNGYTSSQLQAPLKAGKIWHGQLDVALPGGTRLTLATRLGAVPASEGSPHWRVLSISDLSESRRLQEHLHRARRFDPATGLPNRDEFMRLLQLALNRAARDGLMLVVALIDLDGFGRINAEHGQLAADSVLRELSARLHSALRGGSARSRQAADQIARLHGDEFAVVLHVQTPEEGQRAVERLLALLCTPVAVRESQVDAPPALEISASLGATIFPFDNADPETLMRHAGHALYRAKQAGPGGCHFHDPSLQQRDEVGLIALARLQRALDGGELLLHYQPQIDLQTGQVMGVEALLRWQHPERGLLAPAHFLPQVGDSGLAVQIGDWVIEQALAQAARWAKAGLNLGPLGWKALPVCVNVGVRQLQRHDFPQRLQELVQRQPPQLAALLHLDVLESDALVETTATQALIQRCQLLGVGIALDDFGASYSKLAALKRLPVDTFKLDRSYVQGMLGDAQDLSLVESVIQLARNMGCAVLAKGVESRAHARALLRLGCRLGQGNGIAAAMPPEALPEWLDRFASADWPGQMRASAPQPTP
ncbi:MAG: hypothetical protein DI603_00440 [Roseateles depolymerans]|uniref:Diguanylate cyclase n=1 Tax=Roseateles depolymerans TaxID=76731 RepID=A0A2W5DWX3_9BURK|nr:MAG: hypothetical protein DI603_00440 [Roseateles depolymerans]